MEIKQQFKQSIVRKPGKSFLDGITTSNLGVPDYQKALEQHTNYIETLKKCGVQVKILEADERFPDSTFVEDPAVVTEKCAIVTNPGVESRNDEKIDIKETLKLFYDNIEEIKEGTLEGGDVLRVENHFYIGLSLRTNEQGAQSLKDILTKYGYTASFVPLQNFLHLKTGISYLGNNNIVVTGEFVDHPEFSNFSKVIIDEKDAYSANCILINGNVIIPKGFENTKNKIEKLGYKVLELDMSEFEKQDGGLSCLSLRF